MAARTTIPEPEIVDEFPPIGRSTQYPWEKWTDGKIRKLIKGVHFKGATKTMRQTCSKHAQANNLSLESRIKVDGSQELLFVRFTPKGSH